MKYTNFQKQIFLFLASICCLLPRIVLAKDWSYDSQVDPIYGKITGVASIGDLNTLQAIILKCDMNKDQGIVLFVSIADRFNEFANAGKETVVKSILKIGNQNPLMFPAYFLGASTIDGKLRYYFQIGAYDEALIDFQNFDSGPIVLRIQTRSGINDTIVVAHNTQQVFKTFSSYGCKIPF